jgi:hypothetical protein
MAQERTGDLVLPQSTYVLVQDGASGQVYPDKKSKPNHFFVPYRIKIEEL